MVNPGSPFCKILDFATGKIIALKTPLQPLFRDTALIDSTTFMITKMSIGMATATTFALKLNTTAAIQTTGSG
jgi:hypothetical protein